MTTTTSKDNHSIIGLLQNNDPYTMHDQCDKCKALVDPRKVVRLKPGPTGPVAPPLICHSQANEANESVPPGVILKISQKAIIGA